MNSSNRSDMVEAVAIIGMSCRFPKAGNVESFWRNLRDGIDSVTFFSNEDLLAAGIAPEDLTDPNFVKARACVEDIDLFDASFFGYNPREAELIDPQHRIMLECAWEALENAGIDPNRFPGSIGVFAGSGINSYLLFNIASNPEIVASAGLFQTAIGNDKDYLATRISYKLNLKGPSVTVQTACSTSLVAVHLACQSLLDYQSDLALAGGVSLSPDQRGYWYQPDGPYSPDGHCRAFDAQAQGTIPGGGAAIVVLKRLSEAIEDGDLIHAVIRGAAINNDGSEKVGFTAPSIEGQVKVIAQALAVAGVEPDEIGYLEAHGTGTVLGDPIEMAALASAFQSAKKKRFCGIGSVKTNIGHADTAAGTAGLIKTVLALKHKMIPPSLYYQQPNPKIDFENSPFYVTAELTDWKRGSEPRRAGVSAFGIGGTNAHVVLEEAPPKIRSGADDRAWKLLVMSARSPEAIEASTDSLIDYLKLKGHEELSDAAHTLQVGRREFEFRRAVVCRDVDDAIHSLEAMDPQRVFTSARQPHESSVVFMFPGGGSQYPGMGQGIYESEPHFREQVDRCSEILQALFNYNLRDHLFPKAHQPQNLTRTLVALPALFVTEYALARLFISWGLEPETMIGHSLGEYVAACLAGVFTLEDALSLVLLRGKLFECLPSGSMLSVALSEEEALKLIDDRLSVAAVNGPGLCVVSGSARAIEEIIPALEAKEVEFRKIQIDAAGHSHMVSPILPEFGDLVRSLRLNAPRIPFISNVTGKVITADEATCPDYWVTHLRSTVRFGEGLAEVMKNPRNVLLEVGPGRTLTTLAKLQTQRNSDAQVVTSMRHPHDNETDEEALVRSLAKLWLIGAKIDWDRYRGPRLRKRVELPTYPFHRQRFWIEPNTTLKGTRAYSGKRENFEDWFYIPSWKRTLPVAETDSDVLSNLQQRCILFTDDEGLGAEIAKCWSTLGQQVVVVKKGSDFRKINDREYELDPSDKEAYKLLLAEQTGDGQSRFLILHLFGVEDKKAPTPRETFELTQKDLLYSLLYLVRALAEEHVEASVWVVTRGMQDVESADRIREEKATLDGPMKVISQEYAWIRCSSIDLGDWRPGAESTLAKKILNETVGSSDGVAVALRGANRWVRCLERVRFKVASQGIRQNGVYLITGGLGEVGLSIGEWLARTAQARLILTSRRAFLERAFWDQWLASHDQADEVSRKIRRIRAMEDAGAQVIFLSADVASESQAQSVIDHACSVFGEINGVIHTAGLAGKQGSKLIAELDTTDFQRHFDAKAHGVYTLERTLQGLQLDFCALISSNAAVLGGLGSFPYSAAHSFMDAFARSHSKDGSLRWISVNWDAWPGAGRNAPDIPRAGSIARFALGPEEGPRALNRIISSEARGQVIVSTGDLQSRLEEWSDLQSADRGGPPKSGAHGLHERPNLQNRYIAPSNELERTLIEVWEELLGVKGIGVEDNFFELGGHSLLGTQLLLRVRRVFGVEAPLRRVFERPTVANLAAVIEELTAAEIDSLSDEEVERLLHAETQ